MIETSLQPRRPLATPRLKGLGQVFTPEAVAQFMVSLSQIGPGGRALDPAVGDGVFVRALNERGITAIDAFEVDRALVVDGHAKVRYSSFISASVKHQYDLVIGNPPYVRWKNLSNRQRQELKDSRLWRDHFTSFSDYFGIFAIKAIEHLRPGGELIFITPEYWLYTTHSRRLRDYLATRGEMSHLLFLGESPLFDGVTTSTLIFRFVKGRATREPLRVARKEFRVTPTFDELRALMDDAAEADVPQFQASRPWATASQGDQVDLLELEAACTSRGRIDCIGDVAEIGNGLVSGLDRAFRWPAGKPLPAGEEEAFLQVLKAKAIGSVRVGDSIPYIYLNPFSLTESELKVRFPVVMAHLRPFRRGLERRYSYDRDLPYWEWAFLRNMKLFKGDTTKLFVPCKDRLTKRTRLRFGVVPPGVYGSQDTTVLVCRPDVAESPYFLSAWLCSPIVMKWLVYNGVMRGEVAEFSEAPVARIPVRRVEFACPEDLAVHSEVCRLAQQIAAGGGEGLFEEIDALFAQWLAGAVPPLPPGVR